MRSLLLTAAMLWGVASGSGCRSDSIDVSAIDKLVPTKHKYKLTFQTRQHTAKGTRYTIAVPKGWTWGGFEFASRDDKAFGDSSMRVASSCDDCLAGITNGTTCKDGVCRVDDPAEVIEAELASQRAIPRLRAHHVVRDEFVNGRRIVVELNETLYGETRAWIRVFWWTVGASEYHTCSASLSHHLVDSASAFVKACELATHSP
jgi:hypothetical protein